MGFPRQEGQEEEKIEVRRSGIKEKIQVGSRYLWFLRDGHLSWEVWAGKFTFPRGQRPALERGRAHGTQCCPGEFVAERDWSRADRVLQWRCSRGNGQRGATGW